MDTAINTDGDFTADENGTAYRIFGNDELRQKVYIMLSAKQGEFIYDRSLGSEIYTIDLSSDNAEEQIISKARDALADMEYVEVTNASIEDGIVTVSVNIFNIDYDIELKI